MDRFVQLFIESMRLDPDSPERAAPMDPEPLTAPPTPEMIDRGVRHMETLLRSEDAMKAGFIRDDMAGTYVILAQALEENPLLSEAAIRVYESALKQTAANWGRGIALQQVGMLCLKHRRLRDAERHLNECAGMIETLKGHPRDEVLFGGGLTCKYTRREFAALVERLRTKLYYDLGDTEKAHLHHEESKRLSEAFSGDLVEQSCPSAPQGQAPGTAVVDELKELWRVEPEETRRLKEYCYVDEGPTVLIMLRLNEHLGVGCEASDAVQSLKQFRVHCEANLVDVQLRLRLQGRAVHFHLRLHPLQKDIIPEDTVAKLRGREDNRRLEVKVFKYDKKREWYGDLVSSDPASTARPSSSTTAPARGTALNPLTPAEIAALPKPSGLAPTESRPSAMQKQCERGLDPSESRPSTVQDHCEPGTCGVAVQPVTPCDAARADTPPWVTGVDRRETTDGVELLVRVGEAVAFGDLQLDVDVSTGARLQLLGSDGAALELPPLPGTDMGKLVAKWRKKAHALELRFPLVSKS